jgi:hypothetical protein
LSHRSRALVERCRELSEHVLKRDFAPGITASARPLHGLASASITPARRANPEKKGICAPREIKNRFAYARACAIFRADSQFAAALRRVPHSLN